ncbi:thioesterase domain-containing protein, putative [Pseudoxanthomonas sp. GM95]|uniref:YiiD C-terminal domain-containing protein n=1 Tax=Pseudoxanthomonas sp. GM95 TaxID=1881043 RepID=UPI0008ABF0A4|nr:YiiD C-terminal domain-containing protein [Pseudoxanthomonas sp. GM95]SEM15155.1 thioesterase domain-containing protein, putative [Pseudoxanthomonas sp. GM95]
MDLDALLVPLRATCAAMPPLAAMQLSLQRFDGERLHVGAPLSANVNDKGTAFGGSLSGLMTIAGWGLATLKLQQAGFDAEVYVADSTVRYRAPLLHDLQAEAWLDPDTRWDEFIETFRRRGKARAQVLAQVLLPEGGVAAELSGRYVALAKG